MVFLVVAPPLSLLRVAGFGLTVVVFLGNRPETGLGFGSTPAADARDGPPGREVVAVVGLLLEVGVADE